MDLPTERSQRVHHEWSLRYVGLLFIIAFLRTMAYVEVFLTDKLRPKVKDDVKVTKIWFPSREKGRYIKAFIYEPVSMPAGPRPVNINVHGSGFCSAAFFGNSRWFNYCVASKLQCYVIDTDYRKAPEHPCPLPVRDIEDAVQWVLQHPEKFDVDRISMTGFSAGGNLALSAASAFGPEKIKALVSYYAPLDGSAAGAPVGDANGHHPKSPFRSGVILDSFVFSVFYAAYVPPQCDPGHPNLSVINIPLEKLPDHLFLITGDADSLATESIRFYDNIMENGTRDQKYHSRLLIVPNEAHAFDEQPKHPESVHWRDKAYQQSVDMIRSAWYPDDGEPSNPPVAKPAPKATISFVTQQSAGAKDSSKPAPAIRA